MTVRTNILYTGPFDGEPMTQTPITPDLWRDRMEVKTGKKLDPVLVDQAVARVNNFLLTRTSLPTMVPQHYFGDDPELNQHVIDLYKAAGWRFKESVCSMPAAWDMWGPEQDEGTDASTENKIPQA